MDSRKQLIDLIKQKADITNNNKIIVGAFELIKNYLEPVEEQLRETKLDKSEYTILTDFKGASIKVSDKHLFFYDRDDHIQLQYFDKATPVTDYDRLVISENHLESEKHNMPLSDELLDKYLELFF